ncbi:hypothetical protein SDC9_169972 [bioreactor metagenome]|uniref:Uncharacterized protein n=1 Tax=bioreactor metagenome TaxID=1076179 RepID=A0A645G9W0_9ZZZZ
MALSSYRKRTSVRASAFLPRLALNAEATGHFCHIGSSIRPSSIGGSEMRIAIRSPAEIIPVSAKINNIKYFFFIKTSPLISVFISRKNISIRILHVKTCPFHLSFAIMKSLGIIFAQSWLTNLFKWRDMPIRVDQGHFYRSGYNKGSEFFIVAKRRFYAVINFLPHPAWHLCAGHVG